MKKYDVAVFSPLYVHDKLVGALILGEKASGDIYFEKDLSILELLSHQFAISLENSLQYEEIKQFNDVLEDRIEKATGDLKRANEHLKELDRLKDEFVSVASHELRAPMTVVQGYIWKVLQDKNLTLEDRKGLDHAYASSRRLIALVNDMLDVSKIESGRMEFNPSKFDIAKLARDVQEDFVPKLAEKSITLDVDGDKDCFVVADVSKIEQVLINLVDNAVKFTPAKGKVRVSFNAHDGLCETTVSDNGIGIKEEDFPKLFTKFGRLDAALSPTYQTKGTGLGLYLSKKIMEKSGGDIWVEKGTKQGSSFTFSLKAG